MKKRKYWISFVLPIIATLVLVSGAFAAYNFWSGTADVTVVEGMTVAKTDDTGGIWDAGTSTWTVTSLKPGETRMLELTVTNTANSGIIKVWPVVSPDWDYGTSWPYISTIWTDDADDEVTGLTDVGAGISQPFRLVIGANGAAIPGNYVFTIGFTRE